jgi:hypothetical protein
MRVVGKKVFEVNIRNPHLACVLVGAGDIALDGCLLQKWEGD